MHAYDVDSIISSTKTARGDENSWVSCQYMYQHTDACDSSQRLHLVPPECCGHVRLTQIHCD